MVMLMIATTATTASGRESPSWQSGGRILPPPPPPQLLSSSSSQSLVDRNLIPKPPPPPRLPRADDDDRSIMNVNNDRSSAIAGAATASIEDAGETRQSFSGDNNSRPNITSNTIAEVDPILERFQRIVGSKHSKQSISSTDSITDQIRLSGHRTNPGGVHNDNFNSAESQLSRSSRDNEVTRGEEENYEDSGQEHKVDDSIGIRSEIRLEYDPRVQDVAEVMVKPVVPPPPPPLKPPQEEAENNLFHKDGRKTALELPNSLSHSMSEILVPPPQDNRLTDPVQERPESHHGIHQQQAAGYAQPQGLLHSPMYMHGRQHQQQVLPTQRTHHFPPSQYRQQSYPNQSIQREQQHRRHSTSFSSSPLWRSLWSRVEQGLDSLAMVEEKVAERTHQWTHHVTHKALDMIPSLHHVTNKAMDVLPHSLNQATQKALDILPSTMLSPSSRLTKQKVLGEMNANLNPEESVVKSDPLQHEKLLQQNQIQSLPSEGGILSGRKFASLTSKERTTTSSTQSDQLPSPRAAKCAIPPLEGEVVDYDAEKDVVSEGLGKPVNSNPWESRPILRAGASEVTPSSFGSHPSIPPPLASPHAPHAQQSPFLLDQHQQSLDQHQQSLHQQQQEQYQRRPIDDIRKRPFALQTQQSQQTISRPQPLARQSLYNGNGRGRVDEDSDSFWSRIPKPSLPRLPSVVSKFLGRGSGSYRAMADAMLDVWKDEEQSSRRWAAAQRKQTKQAPKIKGVESSLSSSSSMPPLTDLLNRCENGKSTNLLSDQEARRSRVIGGNKALLDLLCLALVVYGIREVVSISDQVDLHHSGSDIVSIMANILVQASRGWSLHAWLAAALASATNRLIFDNQIRALTKSVGSTLRSSSRYSQLYMRLIAGQPVEKQVPIRMQQAAEAQVLELIQKGRLQSFVSLVLTTMIIMTVSVIKPIIFAILESLIHCATLPELRSWPVPWLQVAVLLKEIISSMITNIKELLASPFSTFMDNPAGFAFQLSFCASLLAVAFIPTFASSGKVRILDEEEKADEDVSASAFGTVATLSNLGVSSASRLGLLSKSGALEGTLERWRATLPPNSNIGKRHSLRSWIRQLGFTVFSTIVLLAPVFVYASCVGGICLLASTNAGAIRFNSIVDVSILLLFALRSSWKSIAKTIESSNLRPFVQNFVKGLSEVVDEASRNQKGVDQLGTSLSPSIGLHVRDLWAAHTSKRAWAVRGANFACNQGEVVAILGDDGEGKSRLLTAISEVLVNPAKRSLTTTKVRGVISVGGLDAAKWDQDQLKKRLGLFLNDVRTIANNAEFMSGFTLEEILEPMDGLSNQNPTAGARAASQALQITGLDSTLIRQLPGKLSTVVTANENDLMPSELRPRCHALSPSEWSKLLLARVLAQTIFDNDNTSNAPLVGSLLLLDDLMIFLSEVEELRILAALRQTGAATVFTSHKWASGRLADKIVVVKDGAVVESGTHTELLARGPQQSMYASKWHAMTTGS